SPAIAMLVGPGCAETEARSSCWWEGLCRESMRPVPDFRPPIPSLACQNPEARTGAGTQGNHATLNFQPSPPGAVTPVWGWGTHAMSGETSCLASYLPQLRFRCC